MYLLNSNGGGLRPETETPGSTAIVYDMLLGAIEMKLLDGVNEMVPVAVVDVLNTDVVNAVLSAVPNARSVATRLVNTGRLMIPVGAISIPP